jgi:cysteine synthase
MDLSVVDDVVAVNDAQAFGMCHRLAGSMGVLAGGSSGLNVHAALEVARSLEGPATVVTILCDSGVKYLSKIYNDSWLEKNGLPSIPKGDWAA